jgi:hypothetical protein
MQIFGYDITNTQLVLLAVAMLAVAHFMGYVKVPYVDELMQFNPFKSAPAPKPPAACVWATEAECAKDASCRWADSKCGMKPSS